MSNISVFPNTSLDAITGLYTKDIPQTKEYIVVSQNKEALAIFDDEIKAKKWMLKSALLDLTIEDF